MPSDYRGSRTWNSLIFCEVTKGSLSALKPWKLCESRAEIRPEVIIRFSGVSNSSYFKETVKR